MGLKPKTFWNMSLAEWRAMLAGKRPRRSSLGRRELDDLMQHYPD
ncbi:MAG TPA: phage tail assembly chaperone [Rhizomicrobium sp.]